MKSIVTLFVIVMINTAAHGASLQLNFTGLVGLNNEGLGRISINPAEGGKLIVRENESDETVEAKVIIDARASDGNLELDLGKGRVLIVSSGYTPIGRIQYFLKSKSDQIELYPMVNLIIK